MKSNSFPRNHAVALVLATIWFASVAGLGYVWIQTINNF